MTAVVQIVGRRSGRPPETIDGRLVLSTRTDWIVSGPAAARRAIHEALPAFAEAVAEQLLLSFGNAVGQLEVPTLGVVELRNGKVSEEGFDGMLRDITRFASALPFGAEAGPGLSHQRVAGPETEVLYHAFVYLRHITSPRVPRGEGLADAFAAVLRNPHSVLRREVRWAALENASCVDMASVIALTSGAGDFQRTSAGRGGTAAQRLRGHLPQRVQETRRRVDFDTAENRFVRHFVESCRDVACRVRARTLGSTSAFQRRARADCERALESIDRVRGHRFFSEIGPMTHFPSGSTVLHGRDGYRDLFRHHVHMRLLARIPIDDAGLRELVELKDVATLYEVWCFLSVADALRGRIGAPTHVGRPATTWSHRIMSNALEVVWASGIKLTFNATFSRKRVAPRRSCSLQLRPDIILEVPTATGRALHVLDAKFKLRVVDETDEAESTYAAVDIHKMHTYRDALGAHTACVLYPGERSSRFATLDGGMVAAIPLVPGEATDALDDYLGRLVR